MDISNKRDDSDDSDDFTQASDATIEGGNQTNASNILVSLSNDLPENNVVDFPQHIAKETILNHITDADGKTPVFLTH